MNYKIFAIANLPEGKFPFMVTWEDPDGDAAQVVVAPDKTAALKACCPEGHKLFEGVDFEFVTDACCYAPDDWDLEELIQHDPMDHKSGIMLCGASVCEILEDDIKESDDARKARIGKQMAEALNLPPAVGNFNPPRYQLGCDHQTKTAIGVYETVLRLADEARQKNPVGT